MPIFAIPFVIILALFVATAGDEFIESINLSFGDFRLFAEKKEPQEKKAAAPKTTIRQAPPPEALPHPPQTPLPPQDQGPEYLGWIKISSVRERDPFLIILTTSIPNGKTLALTGWTIQGREESFAIPQGVELVPQGLQEAVFAPIALKRGDRVEISGAANPFKPEFIFRPNECFGYLKEERTFPLSVPSSCPDDRLEREDVDHLSPACQDFVLDFDRCEEPPDYPSTLSFINDFQCRLFHEKIQEELTYKGCVNKHKAEDDFFDNEWHIYLGEEEHRLIRPTHDTVRLLDPNGLIVDEKIY